MNKPSCKLLLYIKTQSFEDKIVEFCYKCDVLEEIDKLTYNYKDEFAFFNEKKKEILKELNKNKKRYSLDFHVVDIELATKRIIILKENYPIRPFFQNIIYKGNTINQEMLLIKKMYQGNLISVYNLNKEWEIKYGGESIFEGIDSHIVNCLEFGVNITYEDCVKVLNHFKSKNYFFQMARLLLSKEEDLTIQKFIEAVPIVYVQKENKEEKRTRKIWIPYAED